MNKNTGFTLLELIVVIIIVGVIASLAIPQFTKTVVKSKTRKASQDMLTIIAAEKIYKARNNAFWPSDTGTYYNLSTTNAALNTNVLPDPNISVFRCRGFSGTDFYCEIQGSENGYSFTITYQNSVNAGAPACSSSPVGANLCPTI